MLRHADDVKGEYKAGTRRAYEPVMIEALQPVPEEQLAALAYYLSHMR